MKQLKIIIIFCLACIGFSATAQSRYFDERYIYTQANIHTQLINPAAFGSKMKHNLLVNYRRKWAGINDAPSTTTIAYDGPMVDRLGMGVMVLRDNYGLLETTKALAGVSYTIVGDNNQIGFGLSGEYIKHGLTSITDPAVISDPKVAAALEGAEYFDATVGIYGIYKKSLSYGLVLPSLVSSRINDTGSSSSADRIVGFIFHAGYDIKASESDVIFKPSVIVKNLANVPTHLDINLNVSFLQERFTGGVSYTVGADKRLGFLLGANVDKYFLYYGYNTSSNPLQDYNNGSHEISFSVSFGGKGKDGM
ncbi:MAG: PorP/SprF family type IX secretion system membrane protein [Saprospiraceae bacterium]